MKASLKEILEKIPDFDDFMNLANEIGELSLRKMSLENVLKARESDIAKTVMTDNQYWLNGKQPSISMVDAVYLFQGFNGELLPMRADLATTVAMLDKKKIQLSIYRDMLEVFRTVSANERNSTS